MTENPPSESNPSDSSPSQEPDNANLGQASSPHFSNPTPPAYPGDQPYPQHGWANSYPAYDPNVIHPQGYGPTSHPNAQTAYVLGIVGVVGTLCCCLLFFLPPIAWVLGYSTIKAIDAQPHVYSGRDQARAGMILGMVGTAAAVLGIISFIGFTALDLFLEDW